MLRVIFRNLFLKYMKCFLKLELTQHGFTQKNAKVKQTNNSNAGVHQKICDSDNVKNLEDIE